MTLYVDYDPIEKFLVGRCGKTEKEAMYTSFREVMMLDEGMQHEDRLRWEIARWEQYMQINLTPNLKPGTRPRRLQDVLRFPWEDQMEYKAPERLTTDQKKALLSIKEMFYKN